MTSAALAEVAVAYPQDAGASSRLRHSWSDKHRPDEHATTQVCWNCQLLKITRRESGTHWVEYWRGEKKLRAMPSCMGAVP